MSEVNFENIVFAHFLNFKNDFFKTSIDKESEYMYLFNIKDSIHYQSILKNDFSFYGEYVKKTKQDSDGHTIENFKDLIKKFDINKIGKIKLKYNQDIKKYRVIDGCHRLSCMYFNNISLKKEYFEIIN